jgi:hypothetical protein
MTQAKSALLLRAALRPGLAIRKVREYGFGRTAISLLDRLPGRVRYALYGGIKLAKIAAEPVGFARRKRLARTLAKTSPHRDFFPESTAFRIAPPGTFEAVDNILPVARRVYREFLAAHPDGRANDSPYSYILCDFENGPADPKSTVDLKRYPEFQDLALYRPFIEMASQYLREVPIIANVSLQVVMPNDTIRGFQQFHVDHVDRRQFKIFIAVEDVDEGNGATMILPADTTARLVRSIKYYFGRIPDEVVKSDPWGSKIEHAAGPAGSAFLFDTCRVVHCGARTRTHPRVIIELQYVSKYCAAEGPAQLGRIIFDTSRVRDEIDRLLLAA